LWFWSTGSDSAPGGGGVTVTDDEIIETTFDEVKTVNVRTVNGKRFVADEQTVKLSKSKFVAGCQCLRRLCWKAHESELAAEPDSATEAIIEQADQWRLRCDSPLQIS
jgi:hypothetical protein